MKDDSNIRLLLETEALGLAGDDAAVVAILKAEGGATGPCTIDEAGTEEALTVSAFVVTAAALVAAMDVGTLVVAEAAATEVEAEGVVAVTNHQLMVHAAKYLNLQLVPTVTGTLLEDVAAILESVVATLEIVVVIEGIVVDGLAAAELETLDVEDTASKVIGLVRVE